jgi:Fe-S oxidoreductase
MVSSTVGSSEPKVSDITFTDFYRAMVEREHMQVTREEAVWSEGDVAAERPVPVLLNFGCNVRQTPHLQREAVAVLEVLGVDFAAIAGQKTCCGKVYGGFGFTEMADRVIQTSIQRMAAYQPERTIQWCSACEMQFSDVAGATENFTSEPLAGFLVERIDELGDGVPWQHPVDVKVLVHGHLGEHPVRDRHPALAMELLSRIPGVTPVGLAETDALDLCDNHGVEIATIGTDAYQTAQRRLEGFIEESGADMLVTLYHGCTRELGKFASDRLVIKHYISILAEALGLSAPDRFSEYWRLGDPVKVMEASRANWSSWGISEHEALQLAHKYFVPSYGDDIPQCPCNGECTATGAAWLEPHERGETVLDEASRG